MRAGTPSVDTIAARIEDHGRRIKENEDAIRTIMKRPPVWCTAALSVMTFLLGCAVTLIVKG